MNKAKAHKRFQIGATVTHKRLGRGVIIDRWGALPITDFDGSPVHFAGRDGVIDASSIYDVVFDGERFARSVNACWLTNCLDETVKNPAKINAFPKAMQCLNEPNVNITETAP